MKPIKHLLILLSMVFLLSGCASTYRIRKGDKPKGIPFYIQKEITVQQTQYLHKWREVTFIRLEGGDEKKKTILAKNQISFGYRISLFYDDLNRLNQSNEAKEVPLLIKAIMKADPVGMPTESDSSSLQEMIMVSNFCESKMIIDYSTPYYFNSRMPWFGSTTISQKVNEKGLLTESSVTVDNQIDELITSIGGIVTGLASSRAEVQTAKIQAEQAEAAGDAALDGKSRSSEDSYQLVVEQKGRLYTFFGTVCDGSKDDCIPGNCESISFDIKNGNYKTTDWPQKPAASAPKDDKPKVGINATITLPKKE